jgi:hypothetical protein
MLSSKTLGTMLSAALIVGTAIAFAQAKDNDTSFESPIVGSTTGVFVAGVQSGGVRWKVAKGEVRLENTGRLHAEILGLLITGTGTGLDNTTGPVREVAASLVCGGSGGTVAVTSVSVALSAAGNAEIRDELTLPASCQAPIVLIRNATSGTPAAFISLTGISW